MFLTTLQSLFDRELNKVRSEVEAYQQESNLWKVMPNVTNSAGNLCLHLVGNLNTFIGKAVGGTDYVRHRELEFSLKDVPRTELLRQLDETIQIVHQTLEGLDEQSLSEIHPIQNFENKVTTEFMLVHLVTHLAYHLGQINYHRRLMDV
jgi:uncharacterized damage-inducible protein DinB